MGSMVPPSGEALPAGALRGLSAWWSRRWMQVIRCVGPVFPGQQRSDAALQPIVVALGRRAGVAVDHSWWAVNARGVVVGVTHAGGGQLGQHRLKRGAHFGV